MKHHQCTFTLLSIFVAKATEEDYEDEDLTGGNNLHGSVEILPDEPSTEGSFPENTAIVHPAEEDDVRISELDPSRYGEFNALFSSHADHQFSMVIVIKQKVCESLDSISHRSCKTMTLMTKNTLNCCITLCTCSFK